jgi:succinyl-CoA synthetase beta subunit
VNIAEHAAKPLLAAAGIAVPRGALAGSAAEAAAIAAGLGRCVVKAQVPVGGRGKAGGIALAASAEEARAAAERILGMTLSGHRVAHVLVEEQIAVGAEMYAAVMNDAALKAPLLLFTERGGIDIEESARAHPASLLRLPLDMRGAADAAMLAGVLPAGLPATAAAVAGVLARLYSFYRASDAELVEVNPLGVTADGRLVALDCKLVVDDSAAGRQPALVAVAVEERLTPLEARAKALELKFIELDGDVGVLANGAGLTMTTMDAVRHYGGRPANFLEIGGDSYTKAKPALELVLANPRVRCLLVNFCGAFARTDVMVAGVIDAWQELKPRIPVFFTIHGTNEEEASAMVRERLHLQPFEVMEEAVAAAVAAAGRAEA